jgi:hypothetical protein
VEKRRRREDGDEEDVKRRGSEMEGWRRKGGEERMGMRMYRRRGVGWRV